MERGGVSGKRINLISGHFSIPEILLSDNL